MSENIKNKVVVITGASSGLGEATARHLAAQGATVVLGARRADRIEALAAELTAAGHKAVAVATDVTDRAQVKNLVDTAVEQFGRVDVMLNNAGLMPLAPLERLKVDEWDRHDRRQRQGRPLRHRRGATAHEGAEVGHIINVSSVYGHVVDPGATVYCATKFAVRAISEGLRTGSQALQHPHDHDLAGAVSTELLEHISEKDIQKVRRTSSARSPSAPAPSPVPWPSRSTNPTTSTSTKSCSGRRSASLTSRARTTSPSRNQRPATSNARARCLHEARPNPAGPSPPARKRTGHDDQHQDRPHCLGHGGRRTGVRPGRQVLHLRRLAHDIAADRQPRRQHGGGALSGQVIFSQSGTLSIQAMNPDPDAEPTTYTTNGYKACYSPRS